ncbi:MAG: Kae1-associated serine/threonine protein kinase [Candidatus Altiarchaeales archaeon]|nr:Kae1-associated serine/threonine protein kinase [Candidatus Altiarchaeales archaeon]
MRLISKAAEAHIYLEYERVIKHRVEKEYRIKKLDERIRRLRTNSEARNLRRLQGVINVPRVLDVDEKTNTLTLQLIEGRLAKDVFMEQTEPTQTALEVGAQIKRMHEANIVHNDLTTSNIIISGSRVFFIDFGLSEFTGKTEDKAVDLVVFNKSLKATHPKKHAEIWVNVLRGYNPGKQVNARVENILERVRYR